MCNNELYITPVGGLDIHVCCMFKNHYTTYFIKTIHVGTLTLEALRPRLPTTTFTCPLFCLSTLTAGHGTRLPSGEKAVWNGMLMLPGTVPLLYLGPVKKATLARLAFSLFG